jgi:type IV pilus assembly protein PilV
MRQGQRGFTLIELLVAIVILTLGILGTAALTTGIIHGNFFSKNMTSATAIAQSQIEAVQRAGYANTSLFPASAEVVSMDGYNFSRTTAISDNTPATNVKKVTVTVSWNEANGAARSVTLKTYLSTSSVSVSGGGGCDDHDDDHCSDDHDS